MVKVGVLALQGAFREHVKSLKACGAEVVEVRMPHDLDEIAGLVIPGGESTTIGKLLIEWEIMAPLKNRALQGMPIWGTCAGLILLCDDIVKSNQPRIGLLHATVKRNAFGRQRESFETDIALSACGQALIAPFHAVFIRAPLIEKVESDVQILGQINDRIVMVRQKNLLASSFHPELTNDLRLHQYFLNMITAD